MANIKIGVPEIMGLSPQKVGKMSRDDLERYAQASGQQINRQYSRLDKAGVLDQSPAGRYIRDAGGKRQTRMSKLKKWSDQDLRNQIKMGRDFLGAKTRTVKGTREYEKKTLKRIFGDRADEFVGQVEEQKHFWDIRDDLRRMDKFNLSSSQLQELAHELFLNEYNDDDTTFQTWPKSRQYQAMQDYYDKIQRERMDKYAFDPWITIR